MERKLEEMLDELDSERDTFYEEVIALHNNESLRQYVKQYGEIPIIPHNYKAESNVLNYTSEGFEAGISYWDTEGVEPDAMAYGGDYVGRYTREYKPFVVLDSRLAVELTISSDEVKEMLEIFPKLTVDYMRSKLEKEIDKKARKGDE